MDISPKTSAFISSACSGDWKSYSVGLTVVQDRTGTPVLRIMEKAKFWVGSQKRDGEGAGSDDLRSLQVWGGWAAAQDPRLPQATQGVGQKLLGTVPGSQEVLDKYLPNNAGFAV